MTTPTVRHGTTTTSGRRRQARPLIGRESPIGRRPLVSFFVLSYVLAWMWLPFGTFGAFGPLIAALIVLGVGEGLSGYVALASRVLRWRVGWQWYVAAVALPAGTLVIASAVNVGLGAPSPDLTQFSPWYSVPLLFGMNMVNPLGGQLGEEPGWRGFALPGLQAGRTPLVSTAILAVVVTGWHVPLLLPKYGMRPIELLSTVAVTVWYAWLFNRSGGSVFITLVSHSVEGSLETSTLWSGADAIRLITIWALVACTVSMTLLVVDRRRWLAPAPVAAVSGGESVR